MNERRLLDRTQLTDAVATLGLELGKRRYAYALSALGIREAESRPLEAPKKGRTKHYFPETAWAIVALSDATGGNFENLSNVMEPYRSTWDEISGGDYSWWSAHIPGWSDRELGSLLLFMSGPEFGLSPQRVVDLANMPGALDVSSYGREYMNTVIDAILSAHADWIRDSLRNERTADIARRRSTMASSFVHAAGAAFEIDRKISDAIDSGALADAGEGQNGLVCDER